MPILQVWNLLSNTYGGAKTDSVQEQDGNTNIWT